MNWRVVVFTIALIVAYLLTRRTSPNSARARLLVATLSGLLLVIVVTWFVRIVQLWGGGWRDGVLASLPIDALAVGLVVGYLIADGARLASRPDEDKALAKEAQAESSTAGRFLAFFLGLSPGIAMAVLVMAALVEPQVWKGVVDRLQDVKAGSVQFTLAASRSVDLSQDIRRVAPPRAAEQDPGNGMSERIGFIPVRLQIVQAYTLPPSLDRDGTSTPERLFTPDGVFTADDFRELARTDPDRIILAKPPKPEEQDIAGIMRQHERDRALSARMAATRNAAGGSGSIWMPNLAQAQEAVLSSFAPHVRCLSAFVTLTQNRRLLEYQNFQIVQDIFILARLWTGAEALANNGKLQGQSWPFQEPKVQKGNSSPTFSDLDLLDAAKVIGDDPTASTRLIAEHLWNLADHFDKFAAWADAFLVRWNDLKPEKDASKLAELCRSEGPKKAGDRLRVEAKKIADEGIAKTLDQNGYSPYLSIVAAEGLSAIGDHASAVELLVQWLIAVDKLGSSWKTSDNQRQMLDWYRLQVMDVILTLQRLSEGADVSIPQGVDELRVMASSYFKNVLLAIGEDQNVSKWRGGPALSCHDKEYRWKQNIVLSYATWVKQYLDRLLEKSRETHDSDVVLADLLKDLDVSCFEFLGSAQTVRFDQAEQRLQFMVTATAVYADNLSRPEHKMAEPEWQAVRERMLASLGDAVTELERSQNDNTGLDPIHALVYGKSGSDLVANAKNVEKKLESLPYPTNS